MKFYDEQLQKLQEQIARKRQLEAQISELRTQRSTLSARVRELEAIKMQEQADVDKLEGRSLAAFFYNVIGKMDEQLNKERWVPQIRCCPVWTVPRAGALGICLAAA